MTLFQVFRSYFEKVIRFPKQLFLRTPVTAVTLYNLIQSFTKTKYYFEPETYLKSSQTSKMKLLAKVVNASRDVFRRVEPLKMELFTKIING